MGSDCGTSGACETSVQEKGGSCCPSGGGCPCGTACGGNPLDCAAGMWTGSFFQALKQLQVELLKSRIQKAWGAKMEKAADAAVEAMGAKWQAMAQQSGAQSQFRQTLAGLWQERK